MIVNQNFMLVEGCRPNLGVSWDTQMVKDIVNMFEKHYDKELQFVELPTALDSIYSSDASFEMITSNTLQKARLIREHNVAAKTIAVIFVHTNAKGLPYTEATERSKLYEELYQNFL